MIDVAKVKAAFAACPKLTQRALMKPAGDDGTRPVCALGALLIGAGFSADLLASFVESDAYKYSLVDIMGPVLGVTYGLSMDAQREIAITFDSAKNEWAGVEALVQRFEARNREEKALAAQAARFQTERRMAFGGQWFGGSTNLEWTGGVEPSPGTSVWSGGSSYYAEEPAHAMALVKASP